MTQLLNDKKMPFPAFFSSKKIIILTSGLIIFFIALFFCLVLFLRWEVKKTQYFHLSLGSKSISGLTSEGVKSLLNDYNNNLTKGINFSYLVPNQTDKKELVLIAEENDAPLIFINPEKTLLEADKIWQKKKGSWNVFLLMSDYIISPVIEYDRVKLEEKFLTELPNEQSKAQDAEIIIDQNDFSFSVKPEKNGVVFLWQEALDKVLTSVRKLRPLSQVEIISVIDYPVITVDDCQKLIDKDGASILSLAPINLFLNTEDKESFKVIDKKFLAELLTAQKNKKVEFAFKEKILKEFLTQISTEINQEAKDAVLVRNGDFVEKFQKEEIGKDFPIEENAINLQKKIINEKENKIILTVNIIDPKIKLAEIDNLGIKEIIGIGRSNFSGSSANRRHNISVGATKLNGVLIPAGSVASLVKMLGAIDASTGYLPELVIKADEGRTVKEYGGGLCQIGTTFFRAAMESGLKIIERRNHSFIVRYYYENGVPGTDATIYDPSPDVKFLNDTANYVLIQTEISGDDILFSFWGTKDGRVAERTIPVMTNVTAPPPTKYIDDTTLAPGETKCVEKPVKGATTKFTYTVTYSDGVINKQEFVSVYKPWQEVCFRGIVPDVAPIEITPETFADENSTNTNSTTETKTDGQ